jgi:hypothetical protein
MPFVASIDLIVISGLIFGRSVGLLMYSGLILNWWLFCCIGELFKQIDPEMLSS